MALKDQEDAMRDMLQEKANQKKRSNVKRAAKSLSAKAAKKISYTNFLASVVSAVQQIFVILTTHPGYICKAFC